MDAYELFSKVLQNVAKLFPGFNRDTENQPFYVRNSNIRLSVAVFTYMSSSRNYLTYKRSTTLLWSTV
jgi:hypothetical protein